MFWINDCFKVPYLRSFGNLFTIFHRSNDFKVSPVEDVDKGELEECCKNKAEAWSHPNVNGLNIRDFRKSCSSSRSLGGQGEDGEDSQGYPGGYCRDVKVKRHPGEKDNQNAGYVNLDEVVTNISFKVEVHEQTGEITWKRIKTSSMNSNIRPYIEVIFEKLIRLW